jgi:DNA (cytosine-5)-methyltransferase 1
MPPSKKRSHRPKTSSGLFDEMVVDNFAGGGGASLGIERAMGRAVDVAINHDAEAVALHQANHPATIHYCESVWKVDPLEVTRGRKVGLAWFSPDCKHFSRAKGGKPVEKRIRGLAWIVVKWAAKVKPRVIMLENVREFETWGPLAPDGRPCPRRKGVTFKRWVSTLRNLGYEVEWRALDAADFGAPTHRKRLFLVARSDGRPIAWPEPSHGPGRARPYRTAAECIDWRIPCHSIFLNREEGRAAGVNRPLAEKTMRRIAMGLKRFVLDNPRPFIVRCEHGGDHFRGQGCQVPLRTVAAKHGFGLVTPYFTAQFGERYGQEPRSAPVDRPIGVITPRGGGGHPLIVPHITKFFGGVVGQQVSEPVPTITAVDHNGLIAASLVQYNQEKGSEVRGKSIGEPLNTIPTANRFGVAAANLIKMNFGDKQWNAVDEPLRTILAGANHHGLVMSFLTKYFGTSQDGQQVSEPLHTITANDRFGLVAVAGEDYRIVDIGLRMLRPRELYLAQGFDPDYRIDVPFRGKNLAASAQVRMCGNSVSPPVAEALVRCNFASQSRGDDLRERSSNAVA